MEAESTSTYGGLEIQLERIAAAEEASEVLFSNIKVFSSFFFLSFFILLFFLFFNFLSNT